MRTTTPRLFVSYRHDDRRDFTHRIVDHLLWDFENVFIDHSKIKHGEPFTQKITEILPTVDAFLIVIGPDWMQVSPDGRRIDEENDPVRVEVQYALNSAKLIFPILVDGAKMPTELPDSIESLSAR